MAMNDCLFDHLFPHTDLVEKIARGLIPLGYSDEGDWLGKPRPSSEREVMLWLSTVWNDVRQELCRQGYEDNLLDCHFKSKGKNNYPEKPRFAIFAPKPRALPLRGETLRTSKETRHPDWNQVLVPIEYSDKDRSKFFEGLIELSWNTHRILGMQCSRYSCLGLLVHEGREICLHYVDRKGAVNGGRITIDKDPSYLIRLFVAINIMSNADMGFSQDYTQFGSSWIMTWGAMNGESIRISELEVLFGVAQAADDYTVTASGIMDLIGTRVLMKESFHEPGVSHEAKIINMVHSANGGHAEGVPKVIAYKNDRDELSIFKKVRINRTNMQPKLRRRILFQEDVMLPIQGRSPEFLFIAAEGALDAILACITAEIVHCNINPLSIMLRCDEQTGVLMDFDFARPVFPQSRTVRAGMREYMSIRLLEDERQTNTHMDDIESLFWAIIRTAIITTKGPESMNSIQKEIFEWGTLHQKVIAMAKEDFLRDFEAVYIHQIDPFYACLTQGILQLKQALFDEARGDATSMALKLKNIICQELADLALETAPSTRCSSVWA